MANTEQKPTKQFIGTNVDPALHSVITELATEDDRSISNMVERLLKDSPQVKERLEAQTQGATA